jgi:hypothetical protein
MTRRVRRQRGGDGPTVVERWINSALSNFQNQPDNQINVFGDLRDSDLDLSKIQPNNPVDMLLEYTLKGSTNTEDISTVAKTIHAHLLQIIRVDTLNNVKPDDFRNALAAYPKEKQTDDTVTFTLDYLLACENALRTKANMKPLEPESSPIDALNGTRDILFIWALAINNTDAPDSPALIAEEVIKENISERQDF